MTAVTVRADGWVMFFVAVGLCALIGNIWAARQAYLDRRAVRESGRNGILKAAASQAVWREYRRVAGQLLLVTAGTIGLFSEQPPAPYSHSTPRIILRFVFVLFQVMLAESAFSDFAARRRLIDEYGEENHQPRHDSSPSL